MQPLPKKSGLRYLLYAFLAIAVFTATGIGFLIWKFTPLYRIDEKSDQIVLLGGYIQLDGKQGTLKIGKQKLDSNQNAHHFEGRSRFETLMGGQGPFREGEAQLLIKIKGGNLDLSTLTDNWLEWRCETAPNGQSPQVQQIRKQMVLDLSQGGFGRCTVALPSRLTVAVEARNARIEVLQPSFDLRVDAENTKLIYRRDPTLSYRFETHLDSTHWIAQQKAPESSTEPTAVWAWLNLRFCSISVD